MTFHGNKVVVGGGSSVSDELHDSNSFSKRTPVLKQGSVYAEAAETVMPELSIWVSRE